MERKNAREKALHAMQNKEEERKRADTALVGTTYEAVMEEATIETTTVSTDSTSERGNTADDAYNPATEQVQYKRRKVVHVATDTASNERDTEVMPQCYQHLYICTFTAK